MRTILQVGDAVTVGIFENNNNTVSADGNLELFWYPAIITDIFPPTQVDEITLYRCYYDGNDGKHSTVSSPSFIHRTMNEADINEMVMI